MMALVLLVVVRGVTGSADCRNSRLFVEAFEMLLGIVVGSDGQPRVVDLVAGAKARNRGSTLMEMLRHVCFLT